MIKIGKYEIGTPSKVAWRINIMKSVLEQLASLDEPSEEVMDRVSAVGNYAAEDKRRDVRNLAGFWLRALNNYHPLTGVLIVLIRREYHSASLTEIEERVDSAYKKYLDILRTDRELPTPDLPDTALLKAAA